MVCTCDLVLVFFWIQTFLPVIKYSSFTNLHTPNKATLHIHQLTKGAMSHVKWHHSKGVYNFYQNNTHVYFQWFLTNRPEEKFKSKSTFMKSEITMISNIYHKQIVMWITHVYLLPKSCALYCLLVKCQSGQILRICKISLVKFINIWW